MSDFHRSLDRALEPEPHNRWTDTQHFPSNTFAIRRNPAYDDSYLRDTSILAAFDPASIEEYANSINEYVAELARRCTLPPPSGPTHWYDRIDSMGTE